jgi:hypothetical protein
LQFDEATRLFVIPETLTSDSAVGDLVVGIEAKGFGLTLSYNFRLTIVNTKQDEKDKV